MKTLTEKYNAVLEGAFPKKQFVRDARLSHPNFITQFTSYEDVVKILKGKGLLYESRKEIQSFENGRELNEIGMFHDPIGYQKGQPSRMQVARDILKDAGLSKDEIDKFISDNMFKKGRLDDLAKDYVEREIRKKKVQIKHENTSTYTGVQVMKMAKRAGEYVLDARDSLRELVIGYGDAIPKQEVLQVLHHYDLELEDVTGRSSFGTHSTDGSPTDTEIPSWMLEARGNAKDSTPVQNLPPSTLDKAIRYELEKAGVDYIMAAPDTEDYLKARAKAEKALAKDRLYYLNLEKSNKKRTDIMEPATTKNMVDRGNQMKKIKAGKDQRSKAQLKEAIKVIIKSILSN